MGGWKGRGGRGLGPSKARGSTAVPPPWTRDLSSLTHGSWEGPPRSQGGPAVPNRGARGAGNGDGSHGARVPRAKSSLTRSRNPPPGGSRVQVCSASPRGSAAGAPADARPGRDGDSVAGKGGGRNGSTCAPARPCPEGLDRPGSQAKSASKSHHRVCMLGRIRVGLH